MEKEVEMKEQYKQGMASIFVVIFTTLLLGIITLGFVRIMISEATQTTNFDLSQSAYDSAMAGVEDAKVALLRYNKCLSDGATATSGTEDCRRIIRAMVDTTSGRVPTEDCDIVKTMLARPGEAGRETVIQSESGSVVSESGQVMDQAYTCVKVSENTDDYLGRLTDTYRTKLIPIRAANINRVNRIRLEWFNAEDSDEAASSGSYNGLARSGALNNDQNYGQLLDETNIFGARPMRPSLMRAQLIQTATDFTLSQFDSNVGARTNQGTLLLRPSDTGTNVVANSAGAGLAGSADLSLNNPIDIDCTTAIMSSYQCVADIDLPLAAGGSRDDGTMFLRLTLPYGELGTSFSVKLYNCAGVECERVSLVGVQAKIDSTGRANDLFRRVEARVELVDTYFPFPEFAANLNGGDAESIRKNFWVTQNHWTVGGGCSATSEGCRTMVGM